LRPLLARFLRRRLTHLVVMSQAEIPDDRSLRMTQVIGAR
jgi:flagellar biosynthesis protein FlhA